MMSHSMDARYYYQNSPAEMLTSDRHRIAAEVAELRRQRSTLEEDINAYKKTTSEHNSILSSIKINIETQKQIYNQNETNLDTQQSELSKINANIESQKTTYNQQLKSILEAHETLLEVQKLNENEVQNKENLAKSIRDLKVEEQTVKDKLHEYETMLGDYHSLLV